MRHIIITLLGFFILLGAGNAWETSDMQLFDLVDEVKENFYDMLGVTQNDTKAKISRAYRKLSIKLHPDKNPGEESLIKFRRLVAIHEVLKNETTRQRYDEVLRDGIPDWRTPVFYYRKLRRMSFTECMFVLALFSTIIHYAILWGVWLEKRLNMEEYLNTTFRRKKAMEERRGKSNQTSESINEALRKIPKPTWRDMLPLSGPKFFYSCIISLPALFKLLYADAMNYIMHDYRLQKKRKAKNKAIEEARQKIEDAKKEKKERIRKIVQNRECVTYERDYDWSKIELDDVATEAAETGTVKFAEPEEWTEKDSFMLIKLLTKYPAGTSKRWEKVADSFSGRFSISYLNKRAQDLKSNTSKLSQVFSSTAQNDLGKDVSDMLPMPTFEVNENNVCVSTDDSEENEDGQYLSKAAMKRLKKKAAKSKSSKLEPSCENDSEVEVVDEVVNGTIANTANTVEEESDDKPLRRKPRKTVRPDVIVDCSWSQSDQKKLEGAMRAFPKGTVDRWDCIAEQIPNKTKAECIDRIKKLSEMLQNKST